jgi:dipeptidyl aminopeptidase/acylaminoacyl peptidase
MIRLISLVIAASAVAWCQKTLYPAAKDGGNYMHNYYLPPAPSSYPWAPSWSPDGKALAISLLGSIWKVDPETGDASQLTYNRRYHSSPDWSPDGKWIIYTSDDDNRRIGLEILNTDTGESPAVSRMFRPTRTDTLIYIPGLFRTVRGRVRR